MRRVLVPLTISPILPALASTVWDAAGASMGTTWSARVVCDVAARAGLHARLQRELDQVVAEMSHWEADSDLGRYNRAPAGSWQRLPENFFHVLAYALDVADSSAGAYDPCAGALVNIWGFGPQQRYDQVGFYAPPPAAIDALLARADRQRVQLDRAERRLLQPGGVELDLSSVAKGFAVDQLARCLDALGLHHYLVEVGGELRGAGVKPDGSPWWVTLEGVPDSVGATPTVVALHGLAVATSGDYRRFHTHAGWRASHTLDPRTGYPIRNDVASVTVIHADCMAADALSTALSVLGAQAGLAYAEQHGLAARFLVRAGAGELTETMSSAFGAMLE
jgi:thiamine biosynthesis lipoprotein